MFTGELLESQTTGPRSLDWLKVSRSIALSDERSGGTVTRLLTAWGPELFGGQPTDPLRRKRYMAAMATLCSEALRLREQLGREANLGFNLKHRVEFLGWG